MGVLHVCVCCGGCRVGCCLCCLCCDERCCCCVWCCVVVLGTMGNHNVRGWGDCDCGEVDHADGVDVVVADIDIVDVHGSVVDVNVCCCVDVENVVGCVDCDYVVVDENVIT